MSNATRYMRPLPAKLALEKWSNVVQEAFPGRQINFSLDTDIGGVSLRFNGSSRDLLQHDATNTFTALLAESTTVLMCSSASIGLLDGPTNNNERPRIAFSVPEGVPGQAHLSGFGQSPSELIRIVNVISAQFDVIPRPELGHSGMSPAEVSALKYREAVTSELHVQVEKIAASALAQEARYDAFALRLTSINEEQHKKKEEEFSAKNRVLEEEQGAGAARSQSQGSSRS